MDEHDEAAHEPGRQADGSSTGDEAELDPSLGPHSRAARDVSASATDVTTDGVLRWRERIERTGRRAQEVEG